MEQSVLDEITKEARGWALFIFALQVKSRLSPDVELNEQLTDEGMAREMARHVLQNGPSKFENELWGTTLFLDRRYNDAPAPIREKAIGTVRSIIDEEREKLR